MLFRSVKGVGETGTVPAAAAVVSAIENALAPFGARLSDYPVTPARIVELVRAGSRPPAAPAQAPPGPRTASRTASGPG